ncbi:MAG: ABC transporter substrate-binding protein [Alphaproteobacteria bacterium]|nr:ABC transporter substrate-binding protein [Alphaproteobacteria bacterium]
MKKLAALVALLLLAAPTWAADAPNTKEPIKVGLMMPYTNGPSYAFPFREGSDMAVEEANLAGGVNGHPIEVLSRDDKADPAVGVRLAEELVRRDGAVILAGATFNHVGLAVGTWANQNHIPFIKEYSGACEKVQAPSNKYWFSSFPCMERFISAYAQEAASRPIKRWAIIAPNYEFGRTISEAFKKELSRRRPDVVFVAERYPTVGKINAQEEIRALKKADPEAIFNNLFESDLVQYLRQATNLNFCQNCLTMNGGSLMGSPNVMRSLGDVYPTGWFVGGIPGNVDGHPAKPFVTAYINKHKKGPDLTALDGYTVMLMVIESLRQANSTDPEKITAALSKVSVDTPYGKVTMDPQIKQPATGFWLGYTERKKDENRFVNYKWHTTGELTED